MTVLPNGWNTVTIADLGGTVGGKTPSKSEPDYWRNGTLPWTSPKDMKSAVLVDSEDKISHLAVSRGGMRLLPKNSVLLVTRSGILSHTLPVAITAIETTINQDIKAVLPSEAVDPRFLAYALKDSASAILSACSKDGTTVASVGTDALETFPLRLPPLNEQKRIADKLDRLLTRVDAAKARLDKIPAIVKRLRQSIISEAASGQLTEEWRSAIDAGTWQERSVAEIAEGGKIFDGPFGSKLKTEDYANSGARVIRLENIGHLSFLKQKETFIPLSKYRELEANALNDGDILFSSFVDDEVRACLFETLEHPAINKADCFCVRIGDKARFDPRFVLLALADVKTYSVCSEMVHGATRPRINLQQLKQLTLSIPSFEEQKEIVRRVEELFAIADRIEAQYQAARARVDRLTQSLLAKAFRGELVPQDPNDEPASVLLERIRAQRAAAPVEKRRGRAVAAELPMVAEAKGRYARGPRKKRAG